MHDDFVLDFVCLFGLIFTLFAEPRPQHWHLPYSIGTYLIRNLTLPVSWSFFFLLCWPVPPFRVHIYALITFPEESDSFVNLKMSYHLFFGPSWILVILAIIFKVYWLVYWWLGGFCGITLLSSPVWTLVNDSLASVSPVLAAIIVMPHFYLVCIYWWIAYTWEQQLCFCC